MLERMARMTSHASAGLCNGKGGVVAAKRCWHSERTSLVRIVHRSKIHVCIQYIVHCYQSSKIQSSERVSLSGAEMEEEHITCQTPDISHHRFSNQTTFSQLDKKIKNILTPPHVTLPTMRPPTVDIPASTCARRAHGRARVSQSQP